MEASVPTIPRGAPPWNRPLGGLVIAFLAVAILAAYVPLFKPDRMYLREPNDQVGYVTTARWLADTGELRSHLVYPAFIDNPDWRLYMPGHYYALALAYSVFGDHPWVWRLPNALSFVLSAVLVAAIGRRLYGPLAGWIAAGLFLLFPPNIVDSFTAMSEPTYVCSCLCAFYLFLRLPARWRFQALPLLLALPFLFRETAALLLLPLLGLGWHTREVKRSSLALAFVGSAFVLGGLYVWQTSAGKQAPPLSWIATGEPNYADAVLEESFPGFSLPELIAALALNLGKNAEDLWGRVTGEFLARSEPALLTLMLVGALFSVGLGLRRRREDLFPLGAGLMLLAAFSLLMLFHKAYTHVTNRHVLFCVPFVSLALASAGARALAGVGASARGAGLAVLFVMLTGVSYLGVVKRSGEILRKIPPEYTEELEALGHDDSKLLVSPYRYGFHYAYHHYPVRWSFVPENDETLLRLSKRFEIGTLLIEEGEMGTTVTPGGIEAVGLEYKGKYQNIFLVFQPH